MDRYGAAAIADDCYGTGRKRGAFLRPLPAAGLTIAGSLSFASIARMWFPQGPWQRSQPIARSAEAGPSDRVPPWGLSCGRTNICKFHRGRRSACPGIFVLLEASGV